MLIKLVRDYGAIALVNTDVGKVYAVKHGGKPYLPDHVLFEIAEGKLFKTEIVTIKGNVRYISYEESDEPQLVASGLFKIDKDGKITVAKIFSDYFDCLPTRIYFSRSTMFDYIFEICGEYYGFSSDNWFSKPFTRLKKVGNMICRPDGACDSLIAIQNIRRVNEVIKTRSPKKVPGRKKRAFGEKFEVVNFGNYVLYKLYEDQEVCGILSKTFSMDLNEIEGIALTYDREVKKWRKGKLESGSS